MPGYRGQIIPVQFGALGLQSDLSQPTNPPFSLIQATNCQVRYNSIISSPGSEKWNPIWETAPSSRYYKLPAAVLAFYDWWPTPSTQRMIACCADGYIYKFYSKYSPWIRMSSSDNNTPVISFNQTPVIVAGGAEQDNTAGNFPRKLFIFSGGSQVQVISGDQDTHRDILGPAADWTNGNYPSMGIIFQSTLYAAGNPNFPNMIYQAQGNNQENFTNNTIIGGGGSAVVPEYVNVYPGDAQGISSMFSWKTRLYVTKYPTGLYFIDTSGSSPVPSKIGDSFGAICPTGNAQVIDDMWISNVSGSITSLKTSLALGQTEQGDILKQLGCIQWLRDNTSQSGSSNRQMVYYEDKKQVFVAFSSGGSINDRLLVIDQSGQSPCVFWYDKDQPTCLAMVKDYKKVPRPFYGSNDGYIYSLDSPNCGVGGYYVPGSGWVDGSVYSTTFQTPHVDFGFAFVGLNNSAQERDKMLDHIGVTYESRGNWDLNCDIFVDAVYKKTITFKMSRGRYMDGQFLLDETLFDNPGPRSYIQPVGCSGKRISAKFYTTGNLVNQSVKVISAQFYFRPGGQNNAAGSGSKG